MDKALSNKAKKLLNSRRNKIQNKPSRKKHRHMKVTVIVPCFNSESTIENCINSVINQSFPFNEIELIIVDDKSTDKSREIITKFANKHSNIITVFLRKNTGTAAMPRNIGIELTTSERLMFLDADDFLHKDAIYRLYEVMKKNNDDFVVGKTIKVTDDTETVHAEFIAYEERLHINPFDFEYLFYHMGPPSKLIRTSVIKENNIRFPELRFAEDKYFFFNVLINSEFISIITDPIYYVNRKQDNKQSLTRTTDILEKRKADIKVLEKILNLKLPIDMEKTLVKRIVEYDLIRSCNSNLFINHPDKDTFIKIIKKAFNLLKNKPYDIIDYFESDLYKVAGRLLQENSVKDFINLFTWYRSDKNKQFVIKDNIAHLNIGFFTSSVQNKLIPLDIFARSLDNYIENNKYVHKIEIYSKNIANVKYVLIRDRKNYKNFLKVPLQVKGNKAKFVINLDELAFLDNSLFTVFIRYDGHKLTNIKRLTDCQINYKNKDIDFYTTQHSNLGISLK